MLINQTDHHVDGTNRPITSNTSLHHLALEAERQQLQDARTTCDRSWTIDPVIPDQSMDQGGVHQCGKTAIRPGATSTTSPGPETAYGLHPNYVLTLPDTEAPHTPYASPMR